MKLHRRFSSAFPVLSVIEERRAMPRLSSSDSARPGDGRSRGEMLVWCGPEAPHRYGEHLARIAPTVHAFAPVSLFQLSLLRSGSSPEVSPAHEPERSATTRHRIPD